MSKKRRILTLLLAVALVTILVACDAGDEEAADAQPQATATVVVEEPAEPGTSAELEAESEPVEAEEEEAPAEETVADAALLQDSESDESLSEEQAAQDPEVIAALEGTLHEIYEEVSPSVVHIQVVAEGSAAQVPQFPGFTPPQQGPQFGEGSGFVWDEQGHIVTNNHVVDGATTINVIFTNGLSVPATVVGADADSDLAVLSVDAPDELLDPVRMGDSTAVEVGELAVAIGNPFGQEGSLTVGVISALGRLLPVQAGTMGGPTYSIPDIIQTDASINPGNSGGVLLNDQGEVIGVTTAIISPARVSAGIGFAIPSRIVEQVVPVLIEEGKYQHPYLGIRGTELTPALAEAMNLPANLRGALVVGLTPEGPAADAGLQSSEGTATVNGIEVPVGGDVIIAIEGEPVASMDDLVTQLARLGEVGETITLTVLRDGEEQQIEVTLAAQPPPSSTVKKCSSAAT